MIICYFEILHERHWVFWPLRHAFFVACRYKSNGLQIAHRQPGEIRLQACILVDTQALISVDAAYIWEAPHQKRQFYSSISISAPCTLCQAVGHLHRIHNSQLCCDSTCKIISCSGYTFSKFPGRNSKVSGWNGSPSCSRLTSREALFCLSFRCTNE